MKKEKWHVIEHFAPTCMGRKNRVIPFSYRSLDQTRNMVYIIVFYFPFLSGIGMNRYYYYQKLFAPDVISLSGMHY